jgi:hypothetical protein
MAHNGGSVQIGLTGPELWSNTVMLNLMKQAYYIFAYDGVNPDTPPATDWPTYIGADRYPTAMPPSSHTWKIAGIYIYCDVGDTIDLEYPSQHTVSLNILNYTATESTVSAGRKRYTITDVSGAGTDPFSPVNVFITAMSGNDWGEGIKVYYTKRNGVTTDYKARLDAGQIFDPVFLAQCGYGTSTPFGCVRFMDWGGTNFNFSRTLTLLNSASDLCYVGLQVKAAHWAGQATKTANRNNYTTATRLPGNPADWVDGQVVQFRLGSALSTRTATTVTAGNPTTLTFATAHGFSNGEEILFARNFESENWQGGTQKGLTTGIPPSFPITSTGANSLTIPLNSTGWGNLTNAVIYPKLTVTDGTLTAKSLYNPGNLPMFSTWFSTATELVTAIYDSHLDCLYTSPSEGGSFSTMTPGLPISVMCELANTLKAHGWFCMPANLNDTAMQAYATAVFDNLDSDIWAIFEQGNEVWNSGFYVYAMSANRAAKQFADWDWSIGQGWMNDRMADAVAAVAGTREYRNAWGVQNVITNTAVQDALFECDSVSSGVEADFPINKYDFISPAPYYNTGFTYDAAANAWTGYITAIQGNDYAWMADELTTSSGTNEQIDDHITTYIPSWIAAAARFRGRRGAYGIKIACYEGGCHVVGANSIDGGFPSGGVSVADVQAFWSNYLLSSAHAGVMTDYLTRLKTAGVYMPSQFTAAGVWTTGATWGMQKVPQTSVTAQWTAAKAVNDVAPATWNPTFTLTTGP